MKRDSDAQFFGFPEGVEGGGLNESRVSYRDTRDMSFFSNNRDNSF